MIRLLAFLIVVAALGLGFSWLADRPGDVSVVWQGHLYEMKLVVAVVILLAFVLIVMGLWWLIKTIFTSPRVMSRYMQGRKRDRGYQALSTGLLAAGAGNPLLARKMAARSRALLKADREPLVLLLDAQAALLEGKNDEARSIFEAMVKKPETRELGLRGLFLEAQRLGAMEAARQYAEQAVEHAPKLKWAAQATLESRSKAGQWSDALHLLDQQNAAHVFAKDEVTRLRTVLLTARATAKLDADPSGARHDSKHALKLTPDFVPAALVAAKAAYRLNKPKKASSVLEQVWTTNPHPQIARAYVRAQGGDAAVDRLKRAERLQALQPDHVEAKLAIARAALEAGDFALARSNAENAARAEPREQTFMLLADIEEAETGDQGRVRHWISQAFRAPRDPAWIADGFASDTWHPLSPVTGKLDAFEWKVPFQNTEALALEARPQVDEAIENLPSLQQHPLPVPQSETIEPVLEAAPQEEALAKDLPPIPPAASTPTPASLPEAARPAASQSTPADPFFGKRPDDPGVDEQKKEDDRRLRLF